MKTTAIIATSLIGLLSACGGGSTSLSFAELNEMQIESFDAIRGGSSTPAADLPMSGQFTYKGATQVFIEEFAGSSEDDFLAYGEATVLADFDNGTLEATADNFFQVTNLVENGAFTQPADYAGSAIDGSLTVSLTQIGEFNDYLGSSSGSLTDLAGRVYDLNLTDAADADFEGADANLIDIDVDADNATSIIDIGIAGIRQ